MFAGLEVATAAARAALFAIAFLAGAGLWTFLLLAMALHLGHHPLARADRMARAAPPGLQTYSEGACGGCREPLPRDLEPDLVTKMSVLIRRSTGDLDVLLIGVFLDTGAVGLYHIAKRFGDATLKVGVPIQQVLFPDIARLWARREIKRLRSTVAQIDLITGILAAAMLAGVGLNVDLVLGLTVGPDYADAATLVILQLLATTTLCSAPRCSQRCSAWGCRWCCSGP